MTPPPPPPPPRVLPIKWFSLLIFFMEEPALEKYEKRYKVSERWAIHFLYSVLPICSIKAIKKCQCIKFIPFLTPLHPTHATLPSLSFAISNTFVPLFLRSYLSILPSHLSSYFRVILTSLYLTSQWHRFCFDLIQSDFNFVKESSTPMLAVYSRKCN